jgi:hypothetical protein
MSTFPRVAPLLAGALACMEAAPPAADPAATPAAPPTRIELALSAAPMAISGAATIMDFDSTGAMVELQPGTNGWLCLPDDDPAVPGDAPICLDQTWQQWFEAFMARTTPQISQVGISYMLQGGAFASNTDPFATEPAPGGRWVDTGPHVMIFNIGGSFPGYPTTAADTSVPYVMFAGTPYAHLMLPVR